jgi:arsenate reductase
MLEKGYDLSRNKPKLVTSEMVREADAIIVMGCSVERFYPAPLLNKGMDWRIEDPKDKPISRNPNLASSPALPPFSLFFERQEVEA